MTWKAFYELERRPGCQAAVCWKELELVSKLPVIKSGPETSYVQHGCSCFWLAVNEEKISAVEESQKMEIRMLWWWSWFAWHTKDGSWAAVLSQWQNTCQACKRSWVHPENHQKYYIYIYVWMYSKNKENLKFSFINIWNNVFSFL